MKNIFYFTVTIFMVSCIKYEEPTQPTLSGTYSIDVITVNVSDSIISYNIGDTMSIGDSSFPINNIVVGTENIGFTYSEVKFNPYLDQYGSIEWSDVYFYNTRNYEYHGDGFVVMDINGKLYIFDIVKDTLTGLILKSSNGCFGDKVITFELSRV